jgi:hypothetical protein
MNWAIFPAWPASLRSACSNSRMRACAAEAWAARARAS